MWVADYVLMEYGTGRDHGRARPRRARLRVRDEVRPGDPPRGRGRGGAALSAGTGPIVNSDPRFDGMQSREALDAIVAWLDERGARPPLGQLPPARLAALPPALLGLPDPDRPLRRLRHRARARRPAARASCRTSATTSPRASRRWPPRRNGSTRPARSAASPRCARPTRWTRSSTRRGTSCATATRATTRRRGTPTCWPAGRRSTSTSAASSTPILHLMYARFFVKALADMGLRADAGAVQRAVHAGDDHPRRGEDVQVQGQRRSARRRTSSATAPTRLAATSCSSARPTRTPTGRTPASRACTASSAGCGAWAPTSPSRARRRRSTRRSTARRATTSSCCARRTGRSTR